ncbi:MAG: glycosyltransferase family 9 protein [Candidatus Omnitrophota bacterium]
MEVNKNILIINPFGIGDVLFSTPLIRNLRFYYPEAFIAVAVQKKVAPILENNPNINKVISFSRGDFKDLSRRSRLKATGLFMRTLGEIRHYKFDLCIDLSLEHRYSLVLKFLGVRKRIGFNFRNRGRFLSSRINIDGFEGKHVVEYHLELLKLLGKEPRYHKLELYLKQDEKDWAEKALKNNGVSKDNLIIGIIPGGGASWGRQSYLKHWPAKGFAQVADKLAEACRAKIIVFSGASDREIGADVIQKMNQPVIDMAARTDLRQLAALISRCNLIITNDGGPLHLAVALGIKSISLFGPVDERVYGPYSPGPDFIVLKKDFDCHPCYRKFRVPECGYQLRCLTAISVEEVFRQAEGLLK